MFGDQIESDQIRFKMVVVERSIGFFKKPELSDTTRVPRRLVKLKRSVIMNVRTLWKSNTA